MFEIINNHYDVIIVGAGPAGVSAAIKLAQNNIPVLIIEKGSYPGAKNVFGGTIYCSIVEKVIPNFWQEAPLERTITDEEIWLMDTTSAVKLGFNGLNFAQPPYNKFTVQRNKFDNWFAQQAVQAGAELLTNRVVTNLTYERLSLGRRKVTGVRLDSGTTIAANIVLLAEGGQAKLTLQAGLRDELTAKDFKLYIKEELALSPNKINSRFNLKKGHGSILGMVGYPTANIIGKGSLWTNKESLSLVLGANLKLLNDHGLELRKMMKNFKEHPLIKEFIKDSRLINFKALTIPHGGYDKIPKLYDHGVLVAGNAAMLVSGRRGSDLAMLSGIYAAEVISHAVAAQNYSADILKNYAAKIKNSFFSKDIKKETEVNDYYHQNPQLEFMLTKGLNEAAYNFFETGFLSSSEKISTITEDILNMQSMPKTISDLFYLIKKWSVY